MQDSNLKPEDLAEHHTDPLEWNCACRGFLLIRFLIYKHIVSSVEDFSDPIRIFLEARCQRFSQFCGHQLLVSRQEYRAEEPELYSRNHELNQRLISTMTVKERVTLIMILIANMMRLTIPITVRDQMIRRMPYHRLLFILISLKSKKR